MDKMLDKPKTKWQDEVYEILKAAKIKYFTYVPDGGHKDLIIRCNEDPEVTAVPLTIECEGVAFAAGVHLGGERAVMLIQSSGVGNIINMLSLIDNGRFPFLTLVTMRGDFGEGNPWQMAAGRAAQETMEAMNVRVLRAETEADVIDVVKAAVTMAFGAESSVAVLLSQRLLGAKAF
jgi:sulfopyruvate decarboxylase TPP-binding subunit